MFEEDKKDVKYMSREEVEEFFKKKEMKRWETKAKEYVDDSNKTKGLIDDAINKANVNRNGPIGEIWDKVQLLFSIAGDWVNGRYRMISKKSIILIMMGLVYFVSPLDLIPDFIVGLGFIDDAAVLGLVINQIDKELEKYKVWKNG